MKIRPKIFLGFILMAAMMIMAGIISIIAFSKIDSSIGSLIKNNYKSISAARKMGSGLEKENDGFLSITNGLWAKGYDEIERGEKEFNRGFSIAKSNQTEKNEDEYIRRISENRMYLNHVKDSLLTLRNMITVKEYHQYVYESILDLRHDVMGLQIINQDRIYYASIGMKEAAQRAIIPGIVAIISALLFLVIFTYLIHYFIVAPINKIISQLKGHLDYNSGYTLEIKTQDEIKELSDNIKRLIEKSRNR